MAEVKRDLPRGMGYKSCFMVVEGATQKNVAEAFLQGRKMKYTYDAGLEKIHKAPAKEKRLMVTGTYKKQNYVLGDEIGSFFYETEEFLEKCKSFSRVYVYMTHRVIETHGFALVENGELVRLFCYDENEIQNIGEPLPVEEELGYRLPTNFEEARDEEFTQVNEDMIMELAMAQVGIDVEKYPYKDVKLGKRFEYSGELAANPYPDESTEIPEDVWNLPEVQRFKTATTWKEKVEIVEEIKDNLTHPMIDAFGEIMQIYASYGRLSQRIEELICIVKSSLYMEERIMSKEDVLRDIENGVSEFYDKLFKDFSLEDIKSEGLKFIKCSFKNMKLVCGRTEWLYFDDCKFIQTEIFGKLHNTHLIINNSYFSGCKMHDLSIEGFDAQSEIIDTGFSECTFENINIHAGLTLSGGWMMECAGKKIECVMNQIFKVGFKEDKFEDISINAAVIANKFRGVKIHNLKYMDTGEETGWKENGFVDCVINGKEIEK